MARCWIKSSYIPPFAWATSLICFRVFLFAFFFFVINTAGARYFRIWSQYFPLSGKHLHWSSFHHRKLGSWNSFFLTTTTRLVRGGYTDTSTTQGFRYRRLVLISLLPSLWFLKKRETRSNALSSVEPETDATNLASGFPKSFFDLPFYPFYRHREAFLGRYQRVSAQHTRFDSSSAFLPSYE